MHITEMQQKIGKKSFVSEIMALEIVAVISAIFLRKYLSSAVNVLTKSPKISYQTKGEFFQLNLHRIDEKRG